MLAPGMRSVGSAPPHSPKGGAHETPDLRIGRRDGLLACNGGSDSDTPTPAIADPAPTSANTDSNANNSAAETANAVRETVAAFERSAPAGTSDALTVRPSSARDPGPRTGNGSAGAALPGLTPPQLTAFNDGK